MIFERYTISHFSIRYWVINWLINACSCKPRWICGQSRLVLRWEMFDLWVARVSLHILMLLLLRVHMYIWNFTEIFHKIFRGFINYKIKLFNLLYLILYSIYSMFSYKSNQIMGLMEHISIFYNIIT